jgi:aspartyl protease family protein
MKTLCLTGLMLLLAFSNVALADLEVLGLFKNAALIKVDGEQKLLKVGQQWKGVALLRATSKEALADVNGERMTLTVSTRIGSNFVKPEARTVRIRKNSNRQYITTARINGRGTQVLVDTGANIVAMNAITARALGVKYEDAPRSQVATASGIVGAWSVILDSVDVGGITVPHVQASVIEGAFPEMVLLGVSYLQHVDLQEKNGILVLTGKF